MECTISSKVIYHNISKKNFFDSLLDRVQIDTFELQISEVLNIKIQCTTNYFIALP